MMCMLREMTFALRAVGTICIASITSRISEMPNNDTEIVIVGGGAAGVAAGRRLHRAGIKSLIVEARSRLGGRAWTIAGPSGSALDLGCGWLHSADRNPWVAIAEEQHRTIGKTPPPWQRGAVPLGFPESGQREVRKAQEDFNARIERRAHQEPDVAAATFLEPGGRWNNLIRAVGTYISGAELDLVSARDFDNFDDTGVNWRILEGYGTTIAACGANL